MASEQTATIQWTPNTEPDLASYTLSVGRVYNGLPSFHAGDTIPVSQAVSQGYNITYDTRDLGMFPSDGVFAFYFSAQDTSGNSSAMTAPQFKRMIRAANHIRVRR